MKYLSVPLLSLILFNTLSAQIEPEEGCNFTTIQIASSSEENLTLRHGAFFIFLPSQGQETLWEISTTKDEANIATSTEEHFIFDLPTHSLSIADSVVVDLTITNTNGDVCTLRDTLIWGIVSILPFTPPIELLAWSNLDSLGNPGVYSQSTVSTTSLSETAINVYPNPTNGLLHIDFGSPSLAPVSITVYDAHGRLTDRLAAPVLQGSPIDLYLDKAGIYNLQMHTANKVITKKVLVE